VGESGELLGYATLLWSWDTTLGDRVAVMEDLFVDAAARGQGVGRTLIGVVREAATEAAVADLVWETAPDNTTAQALYDTTGAVRSSWYAYRMPATATGA
jgi:ribosomal protein S18 acetylase RimI-like enzyme